ncbi:NAD(P)H-dependent oxidoreductase [Clostridium baratii]
MRNILIIVDGDNDDARLKEEIVNEIRNYFKNDYNTDFIYLDKINLKGCLGCFKCWTKTPGECIIKDDNEIKNRLFIEADYAIFVSKISYGMYSASFKVALDRIIPNISPFFKIINGEMHHRKRYNKDFKILTIGYSSNLLIDEKKTFEEIVKRNMINLHSKKNGVLVLESFNDLGKKIFNELESFCEVN